jgi:NADH-quinone oxidoreductase subunit L
VLGLLAVGLGFFAAYWLYSRAASDPLPAKLGVLSTWMRNRFYFDELYEATVIRAHDFLAATADWIDRWVISGFAVRGLHGTTEIVGRLLREVQTGNLQTYAFLFALGVAVLLFFMLR